MALGRQGRDRLHRNQRRVQEARRAELPCASEELSGEVFSSVQTAMAHPSWDKFPAC